MKYRVLTDFILHGRVAVEGEVVELPENTTSALVYYGRLAPLPLEPATGGEPPAASVTGADGAPPVPEAAVSPASAAATDDHSEPEAGEDETDEQPPPAARVPRGRRRG